MRKDFSRSPFTSFRMLSFMSYGVYLLYLSNTEKNMFGLAGAFIILITELILCLCHLSADVGHSSRRKWISRWSRRFLFSSLQHHKEPDHYHNAQHYQMLCVTLVPLIPMYCINSPSLSLIHMNPQQWFTYSCITVNLLIVHHITRHISFAL